MRHVAVLMGGLAVLAACGGRGGTHGETVVDATPPVVIAIYPRDEATGIAPTTLLHAWFDDRLDAATVNPATVLLYDGAGQRVSGNLSYNDLYQCWFDDVASWCGYTVEFRPVDPLVAAARYTAQLTSGIQNASGYPLASDFLWSFTTQP